MVAPRRNVLIAAAILCAATPALADRMWTHPRVELWAKEASPMDIAPIRDALPASSTVEVEQRRNDDTTAVVTIMTIHAPRTTVSDIEAFERGHRKAMVKFGTETAYTTADTQRLLVRDQVVTGTPQGTMVSRRLVGFTSAETVVVSATCTGDGCAPLLKQLDVADLSLYVPLASVDSGRSDLSYQIGRVAGIVFVALVAAFWWYRKRAR